MSTYFDDNRRIEYPAVYDYNPTTSVSGSQPNTQELNNVIIPLIAQNNLAHVPRRRVWPRLLSCCFCLSVTALIIALLILKIRCGNPCVEDQSLSFPSL